MAEERLQKILARAGVASRRKAEEYILRGRVSVDGRIVRELGTRADPSRADVRVDGRRIEPEGAVYFLLNKPRGYVCSRVDPEGRPTVVSLLRGVTQRVYPVGRLDFHASGALLLTNDGPLSHALLKRGECAEQIFAIKVKGEVYPAALGALQEGDLLRIVEVRSVGPNTWIDVALAQGRPAALEVAAKRAGLRIGRVVRVAFAGISIDGLKLGDWRPLTEREVARLKRPGTAKPTGPTRQARVGPEGATRV